MYAYLAPVTTGTVKSYGLQSSVFFRALDALPLWKMLEANAASFRAHGNGRAQPNS